MRESDVQRRVKAVWCSWWGFGVGV